MSVSNWLTLLMTTRSCPITISIKHLVNAASLHCESCFLGNLVILKKAIGSNVDSFLSANKVKYFL